MRNYKYADYHTSRSSLKIVFLALGVLVGLVNECRGQKARLVFYKGDSVEIYMNRNTESFIITDDASYSMRDIKILKFYIKNLRTEQIRQEIGAKVGIEYLGAPPVVLRSASPEGQAAINESMNTAIDKFRKQRTTGKGMELVGVVIMGASIGLQSIYNQQYNEALAAYLKKGSGNMPTAKVVPAAVPFIGCGVSVVGFVVDFNAGWHLKLFGK